MRATAFVALGADEAEPDARIESALVALDGLAATRVAAVARRRRTPYLDASGRRVPDRPPVTNTVAELATGLDPAELLHAMQRIEAEAGRVRDGRASRALDLDLLAFDGLRRANDPILPHPRALARGFVLGPWAEIAPLARVPAPDGGEVAVATAAARLLARDPEAFGGHETIDAPALPPRRREVAILRDRPALDAWRTAARGSVAMVPTMGALHDGHASLVTRAGALAENVVATLFVNPLQFGAGEDLARYPRTFDEDIAVLERAGADAVYAPAPEELYGADFGTTVVPDDRADSFEGSVRPGHFRGVLTVVLKLWMRCRPDVSLFAWKDAQQLALVRRMVADLDLPGRVVACATRHAADGLALSSRNRYLSPEARRRASRFPAALEAAATRFARGARRDETLFELRNALRASGLAPDYADLVDPVRFTPVEIGPEPVLLIAAVRVDGTRLLDNRFVADGSRVPAAEVR